MRIVRLSVPNREKELEALRLLLLARPAEGVGLAMAGDVSPSARFWRVAKHPALDRRADRRSGAGGHLGAAPPEGLRT